MVSTIPRLDKGCRRGHAVECVTRPYPDAVIEPADTRLARPLLRIAAAVVAAESVSLVVLALLDLADVSGKRLGLGLGAGLLLITYALGLLFVAWKVSQGRAWARAPIIVAQLIQLLLASDARDGAAWVAPTLAVSALVVLGCLLAPPVTRALSEDRRV